ncbi:Fungal transcriptional regulatory protein [Cordyceps fumosorosea ARSEF 2679]|uniref:Fungal transcriptional regulatory protein n=1 Tax=Cordyceps fumosorosea (strain ARSEF 2679) TaxID=1081104 RepID=A0A168ET29_CORFA|nr:Fungal transcriptional regulatory protein [Cordyceps fumosorosea ARSEF 2679]OAA74181.1 Fungal transcriptional regulatory protein [Cordyceps fumosorosea ARSEF 2679]
MPYPPAPRVAQQLRPNGSQAACDPCRARKVACDHARPSCSRCRSKNRGSECFYSANAARRVKNVSNGTVLPGPGPGPDTTLLPSPSDAQSAVAPSIVATASALSSSLPSQQHNSYRPSKRPRPNTSIGYNSAFDEARPELLFGTLHTNLYGHFSPTIQPEQDRRVIFAELPLPVRETCMAVLRALPGQRDAQMTYIDGDFQAKGWLHLAAHRIVRWLQAVLAEVPGRGEQETLERVAEVISTNTSRPLRGPFPDWESWLNCFVGANTRWESIGYLWTHMESISDILDALIPRKLVRSENCKSDQIAKYHVDSCIRLARQFTEESDLLAELYRRRSILVSMVDGESVIYVWASLGLPMWEAHGANVAYMVFLGLHAQENTSQYTPTAWSENNRRMAAGTFVFDKLGVMLTGRPPLISHRYYTAPLPLDLRDEDLIAGSTTLANAINSLDERGWNTEGGLYSATVVRARTMMALIRDEVIELTMSNGRNPSLEYLMDLKDRQYTLVSEFPVSLRYDPQDLEAPHVDIHGLYMKIITQLEHLQNLFFIDRLLIRCGYAIRDNLLETSLGLAVLALHLWIHKDQFAGAVVARSFEWIMLSYGAPAAGILCQEVLGAGEHSKDPNIGRATVIQQLSLLVGFFDWVRPSMPNAKLCANCKAIIQQVLDQCLNTSPEDALPTFPVWDLSDQPDFSFELMDTFDWLRAAEE